MDEWKKLEIGNIPSDFFVNDRYEIQIRHESWEMWKQSMVELKKRFEIIEHLQKIEYKYRYKLKPLESIRITNKMLTSLIDDYFLHAPVNKTREQFIEMISTENDGRKVEIID